MKNKRINVSGKTWANLVPAILMLLPLYWAVATSLKDKAELYAQPPSLFPSKPSLGNYLEILTMNNGIYSKYLLNSVLITIITVLFVTGISVLAGYGFSKLKIKGKSILIGLILMAIMIPFQVLLNPLYLLMLKFRLLNTILSMVLVYGTFQTPFCIYLMKNAFDMIPGTMREAAMIDGAGELKSFYRIHLPLVMPSIATVIVYSAYTTWNDYVIALVFANSVDMKTFNVGIVNLAIGEYSTNWGWLTAGSVMGLLPIMVLFLFLQKYFIRGMLQGAIK